MKLTSYLWNNAAGLCALYWDSSGLVRFLFATNTLKIAEIDAGMKDSDVSRLDKSELNTAPAFVVDTVTNLNNYFEGMNVEFSAPASIPWATEFQKNIWEATKKIPYGETRTYHEVAQAAGSPGASRAAGGALGANPLPIIVPCHRVVCADGETGGFACGTHLKKALLSLESGKIFK